MTVISQQLMTSQHRGGSSKMQEKPFGKGALKGKVTVSQALRQGLLVLGPGITVYLNTNNTPDLNH